MHGNSQIDELCSGRGRCSARCVFEKTEQCGQLRADTVFLWSWSVNNPALGLRGGHGEFRISAVDQTGIAKHSSHSKVPAKNHQQIRHLDIRHLHLQELSRRDGHIANNEKVNTKVVEADLGCETPPWRKRLRVSMNLRNMKTRTDELAAETCSATQQTNESELNGNSKISWTMISVVVDVKSFDSVVIVEDNLWNFVVKIMVQVQPDHLKSTASAECPSIDQESSCARTCSMLDSLSSTIHTILSRA